MTCSLLNLNHYWFHFPNPSPVTPPEISWRCKYLTFTFNFLPGRRHQALAFLATISTTSAALYWPICQGRIRYFRDLKFWHELLHFLNFFGFVSCCFVLWFLWYSSCWCCSLLLLFWSKDVHIWTSYELRCSYELKMFIWTTYELRCSYELHMN